jgi:hypothetical protein
MNPLGGPLVRGRVIRNLAGGLGERAIENVNTDEET